MEEEQGRTRWAAMFPAIKGRLKKKETSRPPSKAGKKRSARKTNYT